MHRNLLVQSGWPSTTTTTTTTTKRRLALSLVSLRSALTEFLKAFGARDQAFDIFRK